jgi:hypothetical protein
MDRCGILQRNNRIGRIAIANQQNRIILKRFEYMVYAEKNSSCHILGPSGSIPTDRFYCDKRCSQVKYRACLMESRSSVADVVLSAIVFTQHALWRAGRMTSVSAYRDHRSRLQNHFAFHILFVIPARLPARQA